MPWGHVIPIVADTADLRTELSLSNVRAADVSFGTSYFDCLEAPEHEARGSFTVGARRQLSVPDLFAELRRQGAALPPEGTARAGSLVVEGSYEPELPAPVPTARLVVDARGGGTVGCVVPAIPDGVAERWRRIPALRQDGEARSNLFVTSDPFTDIEVWDGDTGQLAGTIHRDGGPLRILAPLEQFGVRNGYLRILSGQSSIFSAGAVVLDGRHPDDGSGDLDWIAGEPVP